MADELGSPRWLNVPSKVAQVAAVRASRPWFDDFSHAQTPTRAARAVLDLLLAERLDPATYGELVRFGGVLPWHDGTPPRNQDQLLTR